MTLRGGEEELKKKYEKLMAVVERLGILDGDIKRKDKELELSKGMEAQFRDLQNQVNQLQGQPEGC